MKIYLKVVKVNVSMERWMGYFRSDCPLRGDLPEIFFFFSFQHVSLNSLSWIRDKIFTPAPDPDAFGHLFAIFSPPLRNQIFRTSQTLIRQLSRSVSGDFDSI